MLLELTESLRARLDGWRRDAARMQRYDSGDPKARTLIQCAQDLQELLDAYEPRWVNVKDLIISTGRSRSYLQSLCRNDLIHRGLARKTARGWEVAIEEAARIPRRRERIQVAPSESLEELARRLGRQE